MADVQLENGFTRIANELLEALAMYDFTGQERKFLDAVIRLSYGCGKKTATFQSWSQCETFGLARQCLLSTCRKDGILDKLAKANIVIVDYTTKTVGIQKYYKYWQIKMKDIVNTKGFCSLIDYNLKCNVQLTKVSYSLHWSKPQLTRLSATAYKKVSHSLQEHDLNPHDDKPKTPPKEIKDNKDNNDHDHNFAAKSDLTIVTGAILEKWGGQLVQQPPQAQVTTALQELGKAKMLEAIQRSPLVLKDPDPMKIVGFVIKVAEHPTWYRSEEEIKDKAKNTYDPGELDYNKGRNVIRTYRLMPDDIACKRGMLGLRNYYEKYNDYGERVGMDRVEYLQIIAKFEDEEIL